METLFVTEASGGRSSDIVGSLVGDVGGTDSSSVRVCCVGSVVVDVAVVAAAAATVAAKDARRRWRFNCVRAASTEADNARHVASRALLFPRKLQSRGRSFVSRRSKGDSFSCNFSLDEVSLAVFSRRRPSAVQELRGM